MADLRVKVADMDLKNPVLTASGTFGYGKEFAELYDLSVLGGIVVKGTSLEAKKGNPPPRVAETPAGMLNSVGLQNPGVDKVVEEFLPYLAQYDTTKIVNVCGDDLPGYAAVVSKLANNPQVDALEINISCPNVQCGGLAFGTDSQMVFEITKALRKLTKQPLIIKLSPNVTDIAEIARAAEMAGADAVSLINTLLGMAIDTKSRRPIMPNITGGLSGPAVKPVALRMVWQVAQAIKIPVIGLGGIMTGDDAVAFMLAGATAVEIGSANFYDPLAAPKIIQEIEEWLVIEGVKDVKEIIGGLII
ncbi:MAG: dihydroorotate dehydrogenase [Bacillota bacterium]|jgi:dihydroorotate dehydrogenase (NAD+) catalytic subunit